MWAEGALSFHGEDRPLHKEGVKSVVVAPHRHAAWRRSGRPREAMSQSQALKAASKGLTKLNV